jgi:hypothetical protein
LIIKGICKGNCSRGKNYPDFSLEQIQVEDKMPCHILWVLASPYDLAYRQDLDKSGTVPYKSGQVVSHDILESYEDTCSETDAI